MRACGIGEIDDADAVVRIAEVYVLIFGIKVGKRFSSIGSVVGNTLGAFAIGFFNDLLRYIV